MSQQRNLAFMIELLPEEFQERTIVRTWSKMDSYVQIVHQGFNHAEDKWEDLAVLPAISKSQLVQIKKVLTKVEDLLDLESIN